jgi:mono/diheme cytochrome c family protein
MAVAAITVGLSCFASAPSTAAVAMQITQEQKDFFENKIRPIFVEHCLECHSAEKGKTKGSLSMDTREEILKGGETGPSFKLGDVKGSTIIKAITWEDDLQMPPKKKLTDAQIADMKQWIGMGAPDPREPSKTAGKKDKKSHWAFQPVAKPTAPEVKNKAWCVNSIDKFVLAKLEEKQMMPAPQAEKETLLRRAYYDLIGLPPTPREIEEFVKNPNPDLAYAQVIDKLLATPAYGERWARHWLDTARYSDTTGDKAEVAYRDYRYPYAWTYREWVINAFNKDMPYDQFIIQQLAADKVENNNPQNLAALGLLTVGQRFENKTDEIINDRIDVISRGFLGLTVACARCHDHKFDPVTSADYYALRGVLTSCVEPAQGPLIAGDPNSPTFMKFQEDLAKMETKAISEFHRIQRSYSDAVRKNAVGIFEAGMLLKQSTSPEDVKKGADLIQKLKVPEFRGTVYSGYRLTPGDPVYGPFVKLLSGEGTQESIRKLRLAGRYNAEVLDFLEAQKVLPADLHSIALLVGKFFDQFEPKVASLYATMADRSKSNFSPEDLQQLQLATFPFRPLPASEATMDRVNEEANRFPEAQIGEFKRTGVLQAINKFKVTFKGGPVYAMALMDAPTPKDSPLFVRGNPPKPGDNVRIVPRRFLEVLSKDNQPQPFKFGSGRMELAQCIASKENPLTARVMVNRIWMHHFGEGLVRTPDDLGNQAGSPTHPELLDFLANWFMEDFGPAKPAWSIKALHKAIMLSKVYQQSSNTAFKRGTVDYEKVDPANTLLWRANVRRLDFESFRDSLISMASLMDNSLGGQSFNINEEPYIFRRSVYAYIDRADMPDLLMQFDMSNPVQPNSRRTSTIVPQQALFLMNSPFVAAVVQNIVKRPELVQAVHEGTDQGITALYRVVLQRLPTQSERARAVSFLVSEKKNSAETKADSARMTEDAKKMAERKLKSAMANKNERAAIVNEGTLVERVAFSSWETLVQALLFSNEAAYIN